MSYIEHYQAMEALVRAGLPPQGVVYRPSKPLEDNHMTASLVKWYRKQCAVVPTLEYIDNRHKITSLGLVPYD